MERVNTGGRRKSGVRNDTIKNSASKEGESPRLNTETSRVIQR